MLQQDEMLLLRNAEAKASVDLTQNFVLLPVCKLTYPQALACREALAINLVLGFGVGAAFRAERAGWKTWCDGCCARLDVATSSSLGGSRSDIGIS